MSVLQNPLIGRAKQKLGGSVFSTWKGINVLKGKPLSVANPKTDKQLMRRSALVQIVAIGRIVKAAIDTGFNEQAVRKSAFNAFTGYNLRNAFNYAAPPAATLVPVDMLMAQGTISRTAIDSLVADESLATIAVGWLNPSLQPGQSNADVPLIVLHNVTQNLWYGLTVPAIRTDLNYSVSSADLPFVAGDTVIGWLSFFNPTSRKSSDSTNEQVVAIA